MSEFLQSYGLFILVAAFMVLCHLGHGGHGRHGGHGGDRRRDGDDRSPDRTEHRH